MLTISEIAKACGVSINTIGHWRQKGLVRAHAINDLTQFLFEHPGPNPPKKHIRQGLKTRPDALIKPDFLSATARDR
jgi:hypothetical protein